MPDLPHHRRRPPNRHAIGVGSEFLAHLLALVELCHEQPLRAWLYLRKSNSVRTDNLAEQTAKGLHDLIGPRIHVVGVTACVETSRIDGYRPGLEEAIRGATEAGAILVAADRSRLLRHHGYDGTHQTERPRWYEYQSFRNMLRDVVAATILHPDSLPGDNRSSQTRRGMAAKGRWGGRPVALGRDDFRDTYLPLAFQLHGQGLSLRAIAAEVSQRAGRPITHAGIQKWLAGPVNVYSPVVEGS